MDSTKLHRSPPEDKALAADMRTLINELRAMRREQVAFRRLFDEFAGAFLNAQFRYGKATDRWRRRG